MLSSVKAAQLDVRDAFKEAQKSGLMLLWILKKKCFYSLIYLYKVFLREIRIWKREESKFEELFLFLKDSLALPSYSSHHLVVSNCPRGHRKQQQQWLFCCQNMLLFNKEEAVGMYKELRKKKIQLQKDASNSFYYFCRRAPALRRRTAADTTFYISSSACALADKVRKSYFTESYNKKIVCSSQQEESCLPYKINFYVVIYSLTSLICNKDKTIGKKHRLERYICTQGLSPCDGNIENSLSRSSLKAFMSCCFEASPVSPTSATQSSSALSLVLSEEPPTLCDPPRLHVVST